MKQVELDIFIYTPKASMYVCGGWGVQGMQESSKGKFIFELP